MIVNERGHIEMADGRTTEMREHRVLEQFYVGNRNNFITFRYLLLEDGRVVLHSEIHDAEGPIEDFLYEVVERGDAYSSAETMFDDAVDYLLSMGVQIDVYNDSAEEFLAQLKNELYGRLH
jgi:hypothetical protein